VALFCPVRLESKGPEIGLDKIKGHGSASKDQF
jgi:hypothetical protein